EIYPAEKRARLAELLRRQQDAERDCEELAAEQRRLLEGARRDPDATIRVSRHLWRGATLQIADARHTIGRSRRGPVQYVVHNGSLTTA
ncbi:MAG TPA: hypothetical protein VMY39_08460, partial [Planctomycetota bacterium]|nr:hypothetical protein [Planctomycetota bacterium]